MTAWLISIEGTGTGHALPLILALSAAVLHAGFGALQKGRHDPWPSRGAIDLCYGGPPRSCRSWCRPEPHMRPIFGVVSLIHPGYKIAQGHTCSRGACAVVYRMVRGTGPLFMVIGAWLLLGETFTTVPWLGVLVLPAGIFGFAACNLIPWHPDRDTPKRALLLAVLTGGLVAAYTTCGAYGIRATRDPFIFLAGVFFIEGLMVMPWLGAPHWVRMAHRPAPGP